MGQWKRYCKSRNQCLVTKSHACAHSVFMSQRWRGDVAFAARWSRVPLPVGRGRGCVTTLDTKQNNLVPFKRRWCSMAGKVTAGLANSNDSINDSIRRVMASVTCMLTAQDGDSSGILHSYRVWDYVYHFYEPRVKIICYE